MKYRIVTDHKAGFSPELRTDGAWFPVQIRFVNSWSTLEEAQEAINTHVGCGCTVWEGEVEAEWEKVVNRFQAEDPE